MARYSLEDKYKENKSKSEKTVERYSLEDKYKQNRQYEYTDTSSVNDDYINTFISDANNFFKGTEETYKGIGWGNASSVYDSTNSTWQELKKRQGIIKAWLYQNKSRLTEESYKSLSDALNGFESGASSVLSGFESAKNFYGQWETEDSYNKWKANEDLKKAFMDQQEDFEEYSQKGKDMADGFVVEVFGKPKGTDNYIEYYRNLYADTDMSEDGKFAGISNNAQVALAMTEDEVKIYDYYLAKYGKDKAKEYLDSLQEDINQRIGGHLTKWVQEKNIEWLMPVYTGLDQWASGVKNIDNFVMGTEADPISPMQYAGSAIRENIESDFWRGAWDLGVTVSNQLPSILVGVATGNIGGLATMGASVLGNSYAEMRRLGYNEWQSRGYATLVTAAEMGLQSVLGGISSLGGKWSLTKMATNALDSVDNALVRVVLKLGTKMAGEAVEESAQSVLEPIFKRIFTGDWDGIDWGEVAYSGLLGALSAGMLESVGTVVSDVKTTNAGKEVLKSGAVNRLAELGKTTFSANTVANQIAGKVNESTGAYKIGRLFQEVGATLSEQNKADIIAGLEEKGVPHKQAKKLAEQYQAFLNGEMELTDEQVAIFENCDPLTAAIREKLINENLTSFQMLRESVVGRGTDSYKRAREYEDILNLVYGENKSADTPTAKSAPYAVYSEEGFARALEGETTTESNGLRANYSKGKTTLVSTGEEVTIKEISSIKGKKVYVSLDDGREVSIDDIDFSNESEGLIYEAVADMNEYTAKDLIEGFNQGNLGEGNSISLENYLRGFNEAYRYGSVGIPVAEMSRKGFSAELSDAQRQIAYNRGKADSMAKVQSKQTALDTIKAKLSEAEDGGKKEKGKVHFDKIDKHSLTERQKASVKALNVVAKALGVDIVLFESPVKNGKRIGENGSYDPKTNTIRIDIFAGASGEATMLFTAAHELTHFIREWSPAKFKVFADFLLEQYGKQGVSVETLIQNQIAKAKQNGRDISYDTAYEEVIADSCEAMLTDSNAMEKLAMLKAKDKGLFNKIKSFITKLVARIKAAYEGLNPDSKEADHVRKMVDAAEQLQALWTEALVDAGEAYQTIGSRDLSELSDAKTTDGESLFQYRAMEADKEAYRDMLLKHGLMTTTEINNLFNMIDGALDIIKNNLEALDYAWDVDINDRAFMPVKPNSDKLYAVSLDFSTLCRKRLLQQTIQATLQEALNKPLSKEEGIAIRDELMKIQEEGRQIEIACALCYVESARMKSPTQIKKFLKNRESVLIDFFAGRAGGSTSEKIKQAEADARAKLHKENPNGISGKNGTIVDPRTASLSKMMAKYADQIRMAKKEAKLAYKPTPNEQKMIDAVKGMKTSDFTSPEGLENLAKSYSDIFDAYTSFVRNATHSKGIEKDTWWRAGDSDGMIGQALIDRMNAENGLRSQSWSDFQVIHLLDYIAATIELSTKNAKRQSYTKVADYVTLLGNTGDMINMSLIPMAKYNGKLEYDSVEGMAYKVALELREKYHATAGTICIGIDNAQIKQLLADGTIDYVIPYHKSSMSQATKKLMHIPSWFDYEPYQSESVLSSADAKKNAKKYGVELLDESDKNYNKSTKFSEWFDLKEAQQIAKMENANPSDPAMQKKYGVMYGAYKAMQNAANNYLKLCAERGLSPKFSHENADFTAEENYWKLLIDRKMVDNVTGEIIEQKAIKPVFDKADVLGILNRELERYPQVKKDQEYATRKVVEKFLSGNMKVDKDTREAIKKTVDNVTVVNIEASSETLLSDRDTSWRDVETIQGLEGYSVEEVVDIVKGHIENIAAEYGEEISIIDIRPYGSRTRGTAKNSSDLDVVLQYEGDIREDDMFNMLNDGDDKLVIDGIEVDINPIKADDTGTIEEYLDRVYGYDKYSDTKFSDRDSDWDIDKLIDSLDWEDILSYGGNDISIDDISEELNVEPKKIEIYLRRKGLGESHIEENRTAVMRQTRIDEAIEDSGAKFNPTYARKYITRISAKDFIDLTVTQNHVDRGRFDSEVIGDHGSTMSEFDYEKALRDSRQSPYLHIDKTTGRIIGHNGRHRIRALEKAGIEAVEIEVQFYDDDGSLIKYNAETIQDMAISSQFDTAIETHLSNIIPLNESHREEIESNYGEKTHQNAGVKYSDRYSYETLISKPDMKIATIGGTVPTNRADVVAQAKKNASAVGKINKNGSVSVYVDDVGVDVILGTDGLKHGLRRVKDAQNDPNYIVTLNAGEILKNSIRINELTPSKSNATGSYILIGAAKGTSGDLYIVRSIVNQFNHELDSMDVLYAMNAKKELAATKSPRSTENPLSVTNSTISIAELLENVNSFFPDILPESVLRHFGYDARPLGQLGEDALYSDRVTDKETLDFLENQEQVTVYRAMQLIDGKLYPPMNAYTYDKDGKKVLVTPSEIGTWEQSVERPDLIDPKTGKFKLDKGKVDGGKRGTIVPAAYNPYIHTSLSMLNDQFTSAYTRSNLVVVKGVVPKSELTSGYKAQFAKDSVGETEWHSGVVSTQLPESRKVILSRWFKPVEIMDNDVVAQNIKKMLGNTGIEIPYNVVSPKLRRSLEKIGVPIGEGRGIRNLPSKNEVLYSDRDPDSVSNRSLLANALETAVQNDIERNKLAQYKEKIDLINSEEAKLQDLNSQLREALFTKGARDSEKIRNLRFEANMTASRINTYDRQLLTLEASKPLKAVLEREKKLAYEKAEKEGVKALLAYREKAAKTTRELMNRYQESRKKATESRHMTDYRHKIKDVVSKLNQLLLRPTKDKHVKEGLKTAVAEALSVINMDTVGAEARIAKLNERIAREKDPDMIAELTATRDRIELQGDNLKDKLTALQTAYEKVKNSTDPELKNAYQEPVMNAIKNVVDVVGNTSLRDMSLTQLEAVYEMYSMILHTVRTANKAFKAEKGETITQISEAVNDEIRKISKEKFTRNPLIAGLRKVGWTLLKPFYAFRAIGSDTFTGLYNNLRNGEDVFYVDINEAKTFIQNQYKKHNFKAWDQKQTKTFTAKSGKTFTLTLEQMMSLYAYSRRHQAHDHIIEGGIVLEDSVIETKNKLGLPVKYKVDTKSAFNISDETLQEICDSLTAEQRAFVEEMQAYLSDVMGAKGNEVSMELLGVQLFKEKFYFPLKSSKYYMGFKPEEAGEIKLKNPAFSKETVQHANNPVVLKGFTDVWATHINDMSMYHAFVLPLEDFTRVYNYKTRTDANLETMSTEATIANAYGEGATQYIRNFLRSLNGGVRSESVGIADKAVSLSKKGAVLGSASVMIQQPSAIMRAMAHINPIHFVASTHKSINLVKHNKDWAELKQYAPIAGIKEMGRFDVGMGQSTVKWIKDQNTILENADEILSKAPAFMDEVTWIGIWNAVKNEVKHQHKDLAVGSEAYLKKCGERFTEVVSLTQVYDSVFSRSDIMRNQSWIAKALTAFMAEPSTTLNMLVDAYIQGKRTGKVGGFVKVTAGTSGAIVGSIVLNAALKSIITAMRDDDEDESYVEKYLGAFVGNATDDLNPLGYIPFVKDIVSIFKGYDVERMDMALFSDLKNAIDAFDSDSKTEYEKWTGLVGAISAFFGVPFKNVERDIRGAYNTIKSFSEGEETTGAGIRESIREALTGEKESNAQQLYDAIVSGDQAQIDRIKGRFKDQSAIESAIKTALRENDSRIREAAQARYDGDIAEYTRIAREIISEGYFEQDIVVGAINAEINAIKREEEEGTTETSSEVEVDEATSIYKASDINTALDNGDTALAKEIIQDLIDTKVANGMDAKEAKSSLRSSMTSYWKALYKEAYANGDTAEMYRIRLILLDSGLYGSANDVVKTVQNWLKD